MLEHGDDVGGAVDDHGGEATFQQEVLDGVGEARGRWLLAAERCGQHEQVSRRVDAERAEPVGHLGRAARAGQHHLEELASEPRLDRLYCLLFGDLEAEEAGGLVEGLAFVAAEVGQRAEAEQRGVRLADGADEEEGCGRLVVEGELQRWRAPGERGCDHPSLLRGEGSAFVGEVSRRSVDDREREVVVFAQDLQDAGGAHAAGDRGGERVAAAHHPEQDFAPLVGLQCGGGLRHRGERDSDVDLGEREAFFCAGFDQVLGGRG